MQTERVIVGMDWGDEKHAVFVINEFTGNRSRQDVEQTPEAIDEWVTSLRQQFPNTPVVICLEQTRGALIYALMKYEFLVLVPVNPRQLARFREVIGAAEAKDDPDDALFLGVIAENSFLRLTFSRRRLQKQRPVVQIAANNGSLGHRSALVKKYGNIIWLLRVC